MEKIEFPSDEFINKIQTEIIEKSYYSDIKYNIMGKTAWKITGDACETIAYLLICISGILSFAAGFYEQRVLSFIAGCFAVSSPLLFKLSSRAMKESQERTEQVNRLLKALGIDEIPDIVIDSTNDQNNNITPLQKQSDHIVIDVDKHTNKNNSHIKSDILNNDNTNINKVDTNINNSHIKSDILDNDNTNIKHDNNNASIIIDV